MKKIWLLAVLLGAAMIPGFQTDAAGLQAKNDPSCFVKEGGYSELKEETFLLEQRPFLKLLYESPAQSLEDYLVEQLTAMNPNIDVSDYMIPSEEAYEVYASVVNRHPELYYVDTGLRWSSNGMTGMVMELKISYQEYDRAAVQAELDRVLAMVDKNMSDLEKIVWIHDYLCMDVAYAYREAVEGTLKEDAHNIKGAMLDKLAVCDGYANTFLYFMQKLGIPCRIISNDSHAWNQVCLDGSWYMVDVTYDDTIWDYYGNVTHDYLLKSEAAFDGDNHDWNRDKYEACTDTTYDNAFWNGIKTQMINRDGSWYMIDDEGKLYRHEIGTHAITETGEVVAEPGGVWRVFGSTNRYYSGSFSKIDSCFGRLFYSQPDGIWCCRFDGSGQEKIADADVSLGMVYGMRIRNRQLQYELAKVPNEEHRERVSVELDTLLENGLECLHGSAELRNVSAATVDQDGYTGDLYCADCGLLLQKGSSYALTKENENADPETPVTEDGGTDSEKGTTEAGGTGSEKETTEAGGTGSEKGTTEAGGAGSEKGTTEAGGTGSEKETTEAGGAGSEKGTTEAGGIGSEKGTTEAGGTGSEKGTTEAAGTGAEKGTTEKTADVSKPATTEKTADVSKPATTEKTASKPATTEKETASSSPEKTTASQTQEAAKTEDGEKKIAVTTLSLKNKKTYKKSFLVKIRHEDGIKTVKLNGKKLKLKAGAKQMKFKLSKYKAYLKKKGKWNKLVVQDVYNRKTSVKFKTK